LKRQLKNIEYDNNAPDRERLIQHQEPEEVMTPLLFQTMNTSGILRRKKNIEAARSGDSPQEISKKISYNADQISLILKVAGVKQKKKSL
jgi:hypothetical protein